MLKNDRESVNDLYNYENKSILKIKSNDSISSLLSSISFHSFDSRSNSIDSRSNSIDSKSTFIDFKSGNNYDNLLKDEIYNDCNEFVKLKNNYLLIKPEIPLIKPEIPLIKQRRRQREPSDLLSKSPQLSDALKIIESTRKIKKELYDDYLIGDYSERLSE